MKALFHQAAGCGSVRSPRADGVWTFCDCGQAAMRWTDPAKGLAEVWAADPGSARVIGMNNAMLMTDPPNGSRAEQGQAWRDMHELSTRAVSPHYLFHADARACWAVIIRPGDTGDVTRVAERPYEDA